MGLPAWPAWLPVRLTLLKEAATMVEHCVGQERLMEFLLRWLLFECQTVQYCCLPTAVEQSVQSVSVLHTHLQVRWH